MDYEYVNCIVIILLEICIQLIRFVKYRLIFNISIFLFINNDDL